MMKLNILVLLTLLFYTQWSMSQDLPLLKISPDKTYIQTVDNEPFFWLGGTAWELSHRLDSTEIDTYLTDRAKKGFTVIQTVILAELDGLNTPNVYGQKPLVDNDPTQINAQYLELVDYVVKRTKELGLYVALLPTWGDKFNLKWGLGPEIFNRRNAKKFGEHLAKRYLDEDHIIWVLGGDRIPEKKKHFTIIKAMAKGIRKVDQRHLMTYHPSGSNRASDFFDEKWLDFDMYQSGHSRLSKEYKYVVESKQLLKKRPIINGEARYENIKDRFWENKDYGWLDEADVRVSAYWTMLAGAAGYTYGCNDIWQMYTTGRAPEIEARTGWKTALDLPGSTQMGYMRAFFEQLPWQEIVHDQSLLLNDNPEDETYMLSAIGKKKNFMLAYTPTGKTIKLDLSKLKSKKNQAYWFNPRSGKVKFIAANSYVVSIEVTPGSMGWGSDFMLVVINDELKVDLMKLNE